MTKAAQDTALFSFQTTDAAAAAAAAEIFTNAYRDEDIKYFTVEKSTFGDGMHISTYCTPQTASFINSEIDEALRRLEWFGTTAIG